MPTAPTLPVMLELPAPLLLGSATSHASIAGIGDVNNDGYDDIAVSVTKADSSTVYVLFGKAQWTGTAEQDPGVVAEYFYLDGLTGIAAFPEDFDALTPDLVRTESQINYPVTGGSFPGVADSDVFAARWTGQLKITTGGAYRFYLESDDGSRLFIDNQQVINNGGLHAMSEVASERHHARPRHARHPRRVLRELSAAPARSCAGTRPG